MSLLKVRTIFSFIFYKQRIVDKMEDVIKSRLEVEKKPESTVTTYDTKFRCCEQNNSRIFY